MENNHHHEHSHGHSGHHHHHHDVENIRMAFVLNLFFTVIEIVGGIFTNSVAILSDAIHDLGDCVSLAFAWYLQKISKKGSDDKYSYGYKRFSLLGAIINSIVLVSGSFIILSIAVPRLLHPVSLEKTNEMIVLAVLGVVVNGAAVLRLKKGSSINERVVSLHLLEDVLGWVAVLTGAIVMHFFDVPVLDPILSVAIACYVLLNVYRNLKQALRIILQGIPYEVNVAEIKEEILQHFHFIQSVHDLHVWSVDGNYNVLTMHVVLQAETTAVSDLVAIKTEIRKWLESEGINHATIEFETNQEQCSFQNCCQ